jgi:hypothetical protein
MANHSILEEISNILAGGFSTKMGGTAVISMTADIRKIFTVEGRLINWGAPYRIQWAFLDPREGDRKLR